MPLADPGSFLVRLPFMLLIVTMIGVLMHAYALATGKRSPCCEGPLELPYAGGEDDGGGGGGVVTHEEIGKLSELVPLVDELDLGLVQLRMVILDLLLQVFEGLLEPLGESMKMMM